MLSKAKQSEAKWSSDLRFYSIKYETENETKKRRVKMKWKKKLLWLLLIANITWCFWYIVFEINYFNIKHHINSLLSF